MASKIRNIQSIYDNFGDRSNIIINKIESENIKIKNKTTSFVLGIGKSILNYIDFMNDGDSSVVKNKSLTEIQFEYLKWFNHTKTNFNFNNYVEQSDILFDYRIDGVGHYWVDLKSCYSSDMMFRMDNCGRIIDGNNLIVLREQTNDGNNFMHVAVVISGDNIHQIKGPNNTKPLNKYEFIFDFLMRFEPINGFKKVFKPEFDFSIKDLKKDDLEGLKLKKPHIFNEKLI
jgi:hypothetical protein